MNGNLNGNQNGNQNDQEAGKQDEKPDRRTLWDDIETFLVVAVLGIAIAALVLSTKNRAIAHQALTISGTANDAADTANGIADAANGTANQALSDVAGVTVNFGDIKDQIEQLMTNVTSLQQEQASLVEAVASIESSTPTATASVSAYASATASSTPEYYDRGIRMEISKIGPVLVGGAVVLLLL